MSITMDQIHVDQLIEKNLAERDQQDPWISNKKNAETNAILARQGQDDKRAKKKVMVTFQN